MSQGVLATNPLFGGDKPDFTRLAGLGAPATVATYSNTGLVAAVTNAVNFTPPATAGLYRLTMLYRPTATGVSTSVGITVAYKDSTGAVSATTVPFAQIGSSSMVVPAFGNSGASIYVATHLFIIDSSATAITVSTIGTFTGTTYNFAAILERIT